MGKPQRREPPKPESISEVITQAERVRGQRPERTKLTALVDPELHRWYRDKAHAITGHQRRGMRDLIEIALRYAREAIERGELKVEPEPRQTEFGVRRTDE
jgi:hypothetical protein